MTKTYTFTQEEVLKILIDYVGDTQNINGPDLTAELEVDDCGYPTGSVIVSTSPATVGSNN